MKPTDQPFVNFTAPGQRQPPSPPCWTGVECQDVNRWNVQAGPGYVYPWAEHRLLTRQSFVNPYRFHIYKMNDCDWYAAESLEDAITAYRRDMGGDSDEYLSNPHEISPEDYDRIKYHEEGDCLDDAPSFGAVLDEWVAKGYPLPSAFASTEY